MKINWQNINAIKEGFVEYLEELSEKNNKKYETKSSTTAMHKYGEEFEDYLVEVVGLDESDFSEDYDSLTERINVDEESETEAEEETSDDSDEEVSLVMEVLRDAVEQEDVIKALDSDGDGVLSKEEILEFLKNINNIDEESLDDVSLNELMKGIQAIYDGKYEELYVNKEKEDDSSDKSDDLTTTVDNSYDTGDYSSVAPSYGGGSYSGGSGYSGGGGANSNVNTSQTTPVDANNRPILENLNDAELQTELTNVRGEFANNKANISNLRQGNDSDLILIKTEMDKAYDTYYAELEKVDKASAEKINELTTSINKTDDAILNNSSQLFEANLSLDDATARKERAAATTSSLRGQLAALQGADREANPDIDAKIAAIMSAISASEAEEAAADDDIASLKNTISELEEEKTNLENEKSNLEDEKDGVEEELLKAHPELEELYLTPYKELKNKYESTQQEKINAAQDNMTEAQNRINKILDLQQTRAVDNAIKTEYSLHNEVIDTSSYEQGNFDLAFWESQGYNHFMAKQLAIDAYQTNNNHEVSGCVGYTRVTINRIYGTTFTNAGQAQTFGRNILSSEQLAGKFKQVDLEDVRKYGVPDGAVVIWHAGVPGYTKGDAGKYGHGGISYRGNVYSTFECTNLTHMSEVWIPIDYSDKK